MDGTEHKPEVKDLVQLVRDKFTQHMLNDISQWEENESHKERIEMDGVKRLLLDHDDICRRIYILTMLLMALSFSLMSCASFGWLLGSLTALLFIILSAQIITVRMRQRKALFYAEYVDRISQYQTSSDHY